MTVRIAGKNALENEAIRARLAALGVSLPADQDTIGADALKRSKVKLSDLQRVAAGGELDLEKLTALSESHRFLLGTQIVYRRVALDLVASPEARAAINDQLGKLQIAKRKLEALADLQQPIAARSADLGPIAALLGQLAEGLAVVRDPQNAGHLSTVDVANLGEGYRHLFEAYANVADALGRETFELARDKTSLRHLSEVLERYSTVLGFAPLFISQAGGPSTAAPSAGLANVVEAANQALSTHAALDRFFEGKERSPELEHSLVVFFEQARFRELGAVQSRWIDALRGANDPGPTALALSRLFGTLPGGSLSDGALEKVASQLTRHPPAAWPRLLDAWAAAQPQGTPAQIEAKALETFKTPFGRIVAGGLLDQATLDKANAQLDVVRNHLADRFEPARPKISSEAKIQGLIKVYQDSKKSLRQAEQRHAGETAALADKHAAELAAIPGWADLTAHQARIVEIEGQMAKAEELIRRCNYITRDWATGRHDWKLKFGSEVGFGYFEDKRTAEVDAPRVKQEQTRLLGKLDAQLEALAPDIKRFTALEAKEFAGPKARQEEEREALRTAQVKELSGLRTNGWNARSEAITLISSAAKAAGAPGIADVLSYRSDETYERAFSQKRTYPDLRNHLQDYLRIMSEQLQTSSQTLGLFDDAAKKHQADSHAHLLKNVGNLEQILANDPNRQARQDHLDRAVWNILSALRRSLES